MASTDDRSGAARVAAKAEADARYQAHLAEQRAAKWRIAFVDGCWRVAVQRPGARWTEAAEPFPGRSDEGDVEERARMATWLRDTVLEVRGNVLDLDYEAHAEGRLAYTVEITR